jgi:hypothetical protein
MHIDHMGFLILALGILVAIVVVAPLWNMTVGTYVPALKA